MRVRFVVVVCLLAFLVLGQEDGTCSPPEEEASEEKAQEEAPQKKSPPKEDYFAAMRRKQQEMELPRAVEQKKWGSMVLLLERGDDVNNLDEHGKSSAYYLAKYGEVELLHHFKEKGADVEKQTPSGATPLMVAASTDSFSTVCYLLGNNVDHLVQNNEGKTAADFGEDDTMTGCLITKVDEARRLGAHPCHRYFQNQCSRSIHLAKSLKEVEEGGAEKVELSTIGVTALALEEEYDTKLSLNVMTYNIMYNNRDWRGGSRWDVRRPKSINLIRFHDVDILALQEVLADQQDDLESLLPEYASIGVAREDGQRKGEFNSIFYKKNKFSLLNSGTFWLSETPGEVGKSSWDAHLPRIVTWGRFRTKEGKGQEGDRDIWFFNTHFDHGGPQSRVESGRLVRSVVRYVVSGGKEGAGEFREEVREEFYEQFLGGLEEGEEVRENPIVFLTGDLNDVSSSDAFEVLVGESVLKDSRRQAMFPPIGKQATFTGMDNSHNKVIDFILSTALPFPQENDTESKEGEEGLYVVRHTVLPQQWDDGTLASDHAPVFAQFVLASPR